MHSIFSVPRLPGVWNRWLRQASTAGSLPIHLLKVAMSRSQPESLVIKMPGDWDLFRKPELVELLAPAYTCDRVVIDLSETAYIDSTALGQFALLHRSRLSDRGLPPPRIVAQSSTILKLLTVVGFDKMFGVFDSVEEALEYPADDDVAG